MAILDPLYGTPLAVQLIPQVDRNFAEHLKLRDDQRSIGLLSVDNDDATYTAIDEATKMAMWKWSMPVRSTRARSTHRENGQGRSWLFLQDQIRLKSERDSAPQWITSERRRSGIPPMMMILLLSSRM